MLFVVSNPLSKDLAVLLPEVCINLNNTLIRLDFLV